VTHHRNALQPELTFPPAAVPEKAQLALLEDAAERDRTTARRKSLLRILWQERFLTRAGLVARVEGEVGKDCFGQATWEDTFYHDIQVVKRALREAGYELAYSHKSDQTGYYLRGRPRLHPDLALVLEGSVAEVDPAQIAIYRRLGPAGRFRQGCSISDTARRVVAYRLRQRRPELSEAEANRLALARTR